MTASAELGSDLRKSLVAELREASAASAEGSLWALFLDAMRRPLLADELDEGEVPLTDQRVREIAYLLGHVGADAVFVAITRASGAPYDRDRALYRQLRALMLSARTELLDLVVIGAGRWWSAASESTAAV